MKRMITLITALVLLSAVMLTACVPEPPGPPGESLDDTQAGLLMQSPPSGHSETPETPPTLADAGFYRTLNHDGVVGVWISYIELTGVFSQGRVYGRNSHTPQTSEQFRAAFSEMLDNCAAFGINTVYVHLRPFGDALYASDYFPWSKFAAGTLGRVPGGNTPFDPLEIMLEEAQARGISFHGWLNPMRIQHSADIASVSEDYLIGQWYRCDEKRGRYIVEHRGNWYLNPAYPEVRELIADGVRELSERYDIDGIHIDDYFYPTTESSFDEAAFADLGESYASLGDFRRANINAMVRLMYSAAKAGNPNGLFGISPAACFENNHDKLYADVALWTQNVGFADYIIPQIYFGFAHPTLPFEETARQWAQLSENSRTRLYCGLAAYKVGAEDKNAGEARREWIDEKLILRRQIELVRDFPEYSGVVFFSYNFLFSESHMNAALRDEVSAVAAVLNPRSFS
ncbi:MAG: family 10 glycosylhydrolase [Oscillospiraceae bacterium]|nr:family 10 glycosylhydrolase [Oscillospiraceae bacterium]